MGWVGGGGWGGVGVGVIFKYSTVTFNYKYSTVTFNLANVINKAHTQS